MKRINLDKKKLQEKKFLLIKQNVASLSDLQSQTIVGASTNYWCATGQNSNACATANCGGGSGPATTGLAGCASDTNPSGQAATCYAYTCVQDAQTWCV